MQAYQQKTEKFFVSEEKKFGRIDSRSQSYIIFLTQNLSYFFYLVIANLQFSEFYMIGTKSNHNKSTGQEINFLLFTALIIIKTNRQSYLKNLSEKG